MRLVIDGNNWTMRALHTLLSALAADGRSSTRQAASRFAAITRSMFPEPSQRNVDCVRSHELEAIGEAVWEAWKASTSAALPAWTCAVRTCDDWLRAVASVSFLRPAPAPCWEGARWRCLLPVGVQRALPAEDHDYHADMIPLITEAVPAYLLCDLAYALARWLWYFPAIHAVTLVFDPTPIQPPAHCVGLVGSWRRMVATSYKRRDYSSQDLTRRRAMRAMVAAFAEHAAALLPTLGVEVVRLTPKQLVKTAPGPAPWVRQPEGDDLIAWVVERRRAKGESQVIVSTDRDMWMLATRAGDPAPVGLLPSWTPSGQRSPAIAYQDWCAGSSRSAKGSWSVRHPFQDKDCVTADRALSPAQVWLAKALAGDASDNVGGLPSVGPKRAAAIVRAVAEDVGHAPLVLARDCLGSLAARQPTFVSDVGGFPRRWTELETTPDHVRPAVDALVADLPTADVCASLVRRLPKRVVDRELPKVGDFIRSVLTPMTLHAPTPAVIDMVGGPEVSPAYGGCGTAATALNLLAAWLGKDGPYKNLALSAAVHDRLQADLTYENPQRPWPARIYSFAPLLQRTDLMTLKKEGGR